MYCDCKIFCASDVTKEKAGESYFGICYIQSRVIRLPRESKALKIKVNPIKKFLVVILLIAELF